MTTPEERSAHARAAKKTPKPPNPWDRPEAPETGDQDDLALYEAVGRALSTWERMEERLAVLFSFLIGLDVPSDAAARAYGSILAFQQRRVMLEQAAEVYFDLHPDAELQTLFDDALSYADGFAGRRNDIAHGMVMSFFDPDRNIIFVMRPPFYNSTKVTWIGKAAYVYNAAQIDKFTLGFDEAHRRIDHLIRQIEAKHIPGHDSEFWQQADG
jgi:hypothetical protein